LIYCYAEPVADSEESTKNPHAVALGARGGKARAKRLSKEEKSEIARSGGKKGGLARAKKIPSAKRIAQARKAAQARWSKRK
jgi:general stress protein YciG